MFLGNLVSHVCSSQAHLGCVHKYNAYWYQNRKEKMYIMKYYVRDYKLDINLLCDKCAQIQKTDVFYTHSQKENYSALFYYFLLNSHMTQGHKVMRCVTQ